MELDYRSSKCKGSDSLNLRIKTNIDVPKDLKKYLEFTVGTYHNLSRNKADGSSDILWNQMLRPVRDIFKLLDESQKNILLQGLIHMNMEVQSFFAAEGAACIKRLNNILANTIYEIDDKLNLLQIIINYTASEINLGDYSEAGARDQDNEAMTFTHEQAIKLASMGIIAKIMIPVIGTYIDHIKGSSSDNSLKEIHAISIFDKVFERRVPDIVDKTMSYIDYIVRKQLKREESRMRRASMQGLTVNNIKINMYANLIIKNYANMDFFRAESKGFMVFTFTCIKKYVESKTCFSTSPLRAVSIREDPNHGDDDSSLSQMEVDSAVSKYPIDTIHILRNSLVYVKNNMLTELEISYDDYMNTVNYYKENPIVINELNVLIVQTVFSQRCNGTSRTLKMLNANDMIELISLIQLQALKLNLPQAASLLSCTISEELKTERTTEDIDITLTYNSSHSYKDLMNEMTMSPIPKKDAPKALENSITNITETVTSRHCYFNLSPMLWKLLESENYNGQAIRFTQELIPQVARLINYNIGIN